MSVTRTLSSKAWPSGRRACPAGTSRARCSPARPRPGRHRAPASAGAAAAGRTAARARHRGARARSGGRACRPRRFALRNPPASSPRRTATSPSTTTCARPLDTPLHSPTVPQLGAQRGRRLLDHRHRQPRGVHGHQRRGYTFGAGLLEALTQLESQQRPVLFVAYDAEACGPLATLVSSRGLVGAGLLLSPRRGVSTVAELHWSLAGQGPVPVTQPSPQNAPWVAGNAMASACRFSRRWPGIRLRSRWLPGRRLRSISRFDDRRTASRKFAAGVRHQEAILKSARTAFEAPDLDSQFVRQGFDTRRE